MTQTAEPNADSSPTSPGRSKGKRSRRAVKARARAITKKVIRGAENSPRAGKKRAAGGRGLAKGLAKHREMRETSTQKIYDIQSKVYDATFGRLVKKRIAKAIVEHVNLQQGQIVLDLGIGTGASLNYFPADRGEIVGIDLSGGMLEKALDKISASGRDNCTLARANALQLPFADDSFDTLFVSHVISVVSDPVQVMRECCRVGKPGAKIVMVNHFQSTNRLVAAMEKLVCPICTKLGWRSDLALADLVNKTGVSVDYRYKLTTPDLWETVVITNNK